MYKMWERPWQLGAGKNSCGYRNFCRTSTMPQRHYYSLAPVAMVSNWGKFDYIICLFPAGKSRTGEAERPAGPEYLAGTGDNIEVESFLGDTARIRCVPEGGKSSLCGGLLQTYKALSWAWSGRRPEYGSRGKSAPSERAAKRVSRSEGSKFFLEGGGGQI